MRPLLIPLTFIGLDVVVTYFLRFVLLWTPVPVLQHPLLNIWLTSLLRGTLFILSFTHIFQKLQDCPVWLQKQDALQAWIVLCLMSPSYATFKMLCCIQNNEVLWGWYSLKWLSQAYVTTALLVLLWQKYAPHSKDRAEKKSGASLTRLLSYMVPDIRRFAVVVVFLVISSLGEMAIPYYTGRMTDWIISDENPDAFFSAITAMTLITVMSAVSEFVCDLIYNVTMSKIHMRIQSLVFRSVLRQEIAFFDTASTGDITSRITTDTNTMSESLSEKLSLLMWYFMRLVCLSGFMLSLSWKLSLFTAIGLPIIWIIPEYSGKFYQKLSVKVQTSLAEANKVATEVFSCIKTVRSFANEDGEAKRYSNMLEETYRLNKTEAVAYAVSTWTNSLSSLALKVSILYYGAKLVTADDVSSGDLVSFVLYELQFTSAIEVLISYYPHVNKAVGASEKIFEYMDRTPSMTTVGTLAPHSLKGHVLFKNISFAYPGRPDTMVLKDVSLELRPGEITALVGPSGSGKTTCVSLLERFYEPQAGQVLLDGVSIQEYDNKYFHRKIALVSQEPMLFARSVEENIAYGLGKPCQEDVKNAAKLANAHEFISELKEGYNTDAGEKGGQLSGGQKQRVAIARALLRDPSVLILDDATSSLDTESEHMVQSAIFNRKQNCSVLVIAHRLSTVEKANRIIVLEDGRVVEQGTHTGLLQNQGTYYRLIQKMMKGFDRSGNQEPECE
ncbi:ABCB9 protein, partial [Polypterus senegalus]|nr:ABCB9 protein [Polypterus senegalus]